MKTPELSRAETEEVDARRLSIAHTSIGVGILVMAGVSVWLSLGRPQGLELDRELANWIFVFLAMSAGLHLLVLVLLRQVIAHAVGGRYLPYGIVRWALAEGVAVYGLVLAVVGGFPMSWLLPFFALAVYLHWSQRPSASDHRTFLNALR